MPLPTSNDRLGYVLDAVVSAFPLSQEVLDALKAKRQEPGFKDMDDQAFLEAVAKATTESNPSPQQRVPRSLWNQVELQNTISQIIRDGTPPKFTLQEIKKFIGKTSANPAEQFKADLAGQFHSVVFESQITPIDLENPVVKPMFQQMVATGLLLQAEYDYLASMPDPNWTELVNVPSIMEQLTGTICVPTLDEIALTRG